MTEHSTTALADPPRTVAHSAHVSAAARGPQRQVAVEVVECHCFDPSRFCDLDHANE